MASFLIDIAPFVRSSSQAFRNLRTIRNVEGGVGEVRQKKKKNGGTFASTGFLSHITLYKSYILKSSFSMLTFA